MAARSKRSADERRLAILREIANEGANRNCLECHQRGPTYVDMTIGSFVCTKCCGLLRGLNPPHRTKSITMTSFTDEEIDFIRNRGNEFNRYVYLGTYDERSNLEKESLREDHKIREFLVQKYERKRWFVDPEIAQHKMQLDRRQKAAAEQGVSLTGGSVSMPSKPPATFATRSQPVTPAGGELWSPLPSHSATSTSFAADMFGFSRDPAPMAVVGQPKSSTSSVPSRDIFDPFQSASSQALTTAISAPPKVQAKATANDFADFESAFGGPAPEIPPPAVHSQALPTMLPMRPTTEAVVTKDEPKTQVPQADRYAALAELDEMFSGQKTDTSTNFADSAKASDPWNNQQTSAVVPPSNPFSPSGPLPSSTTSTTNPWGSPAASQSSTAATTSPNPFAMANKSWGGTSPVLKDRITPTGAVMGVTSGLAGMQLNGQMTPSNGGWSNGSLPIGSNTFLQNTPRQVQNAFPVSWGAQPFVQNGLKQQQPQPDNWAVFGQHQQPQWPNGSATTPSTTTNNCWAGTNGANSTNFAEVWPQQIPNSASSPSIAARSTSPTANPTQPNKVLPQSLSLHSPFATSNGSSGISNGSRYVNPFAANGASGVSTAARVCSTSNPFL
ncbi:arf-GAP domain and FG repeat-containing protein 1 [Galendromus occidentalis]|uniref:Arf-GAP domain and FG repeat-containing protein 1 n=1 Tax=Galendromus occidentalis TaxID=34638 RepID=A0AAJ6QT99_9ACAR|nr:arf-GAP domain and FG repeat-containing protein 1 [Galendromus occidentalis]